MEKGQGSRPRVFPEMTSQKRPPLVSLTSFQAQEGHLHHTDRTVHNYLAGGQNSNSLLPLQLIS
jgi:hypothetical protein